MATPRSMPALVGRPARIGGRLRRRLLDLLHALPAALAGATRRARARRHLAALDDRQLRDIGLTHAEAAREARRHFWD